MEDIVFKIWNLSGKVENAIQNKEEVELKKVKAEFCDMIARGEHLQTSLTKDFNHFHFNTGSQEQNVNFSHILRYLDKAIENIGHRPSKNKFGESNSCLELIWFARIAYERILESLEIKSLTKTKLKEYNLFLASLSNKILSVYKQIEPYLTQRECNSLYEIREIIDMARENKFGFGYPIYDSFDALTEQY